MPRVLAVDVGGRRIGLAISDPSRRLARPLATLAVRTADEGVARVADEIVRLDGPPTDETARVEAFIGALKTRTALPIVTADERLTSREAESRLSVQER